MGLIMGTILGLVGLIHVDGRQMLHATLRAMGIAVIVVLVSGFIGLVCGYLFFTTSGDGWSFPSGIEDRRNYSTVGFMHNFGYLGGVLGVIAGIVASVVNQHPDTPKADRTRKRNLVLKALAILLIVPVLLFIGFYLLLIMMFTSLNRDFHVWTFLAVGVGIMALLMAWIIRKRRAALVGFVIIAVAVLCSSGKELHYWWTKGRYEVVASDINWGQYRPFAPNSKLVTLDEPLAQTLIGDLPTMSGAYAFYPVYAAAVQAIYPRSEDNYWKEVKTEGSDTLFKKLLAGEVDMIFALAPSTEQLAEAEAAGLSLEMTPLSHEAFVFYVNSKNPISNLSSDDIRGIYSGRMIDWKEVGAPKSAKIIPFQRNKNSGSQTALERIMGGTPIMKASEEKRLGGMGDIIVATANYRNFDEALGFSFRYYATEMVSNDKIKLLSIDGIAPTPENIASGAYPFIETGYIITVKERMGNVQKFIDFMLSPQGREIIEKTGYVFYTE